MRLMQVEVHSTMKQISPIRTIVFAFMLLVFTCMLASSMIQNRQKSADILRVHPDHWDISFQRPEGFVQGEIVQSQIGQSMTFVLQFQNGVKIDLAVWQIPLSANTKPEQPSQSLMRWLQTQSSWSLTRLLQLGQGHATQTNDRLGRVDAIELIDHNISTVVRVGKFFNSLAYGVSMTTYGTDLKRSHYTLFDRICRSIKLESK